MFRPRENDNKRSLKRTSSAFLGYVIFPTCQTGEMAVDDADDE